MKDQISLDRVNKLHPKLRDEARGLIELAETKISPHLAIRVVQGLRTIKEQNALYAQGRTAPGKIVTKAKGGSSFHNYGLAIDFAFLVDGKEISWSTVKDWDLDGRADWYEVVDIFKAAGWEFGGDWKSLKDYPHLQKTFGYTWKQLYKKYSNKEYILGTEYVNI